MLPPVIKSTAKQVNFAEIYFANRKLLQFLQALNLTKNENLRLLSMQNLWFHWNLISQVYAFHEMCKIKLPAKLSCFTVITLYSFIWELNIKETRMCHQGSADHLCILIASQKQTCQGQGEKEQYTSRWIVNHMGVHRGRFCSMNSWLRSFCSNLLCIDWVIF